MNRKMGFRRIKYLLFGFLVIFVITSCKVTGYHKVPETPGIDSIFIFSGDFTKALYSTDINIYGHNLTGLTLIKKTSDSYRVVSMSEIGMKYFDFEFPLYEGGLVTKHYVMGVLDKKLLVNMIISDFRLLLNYPCLCSCKPKINNKMYAADCGKLWYLIQKSGQINSVVNPRFLFSDKELIQLYYNNTEYPSEIKIDRGKINFSYSAIKN